MNQTKRREYPVDIEAWQKHKVPRDVIQVMMFVYVKNWEGQAPTWGEVARFMGWPGPRDSWGKRFKRMRRWGLRWTHNKERSLRIDKEVIPFLTESMIVKG